MASRRPPTPLSLPAPQQRCSSRLCRSWLRPCRWQWRQCLNELRDGIRRKTLHSYSRRWMWAISRRAKAWRRPPELTILRWTANHLAMSASIRADLSARLTGIRLRYHGFEGEALRKLEGTKALASRGELRSRETCFMFMSFRA